MQGTGGAGRQPVDIQSLSWRPSTSLGVKGKQVNLKNFFKSFFSKDSGRGGFAAAVSGTVRVSGDKTKIDSYRSELKALQGEIRQLKAEYKQAKAELSNPSIDKTATGRKIDEAREKLHTKRQQWQDVQNKFRKTAPLLGRIRFASVGLAEKQIDRLFKGTHKMVTGSQARLEQAVANLRAARTMDLLDSSGLTGSSSETSNLSVAQSNLTNTIKNLHDESNLDTETMKEIETLVRDGDLKLEELPSGVQDKIKVRLDVDMSSRAVSTLQRAITEDEVKAESLSVYRLQDAAQLYGQMTEKLASWKSDSDQHTDVSLGGQTDLTQALKKMKQGLMGSVGLRSQDANSQGRLTPTLQHMLRGMGADGADKKGPELYSAVQESSALFHTACAFTGCDEDFRAIMMIDTALELVAEGKMHPELAAGLTKALTYDAAGAGFGANELIQYVNAAASLANPLVALLKEHT